MKTGKKDYCSYSPDFNFGYACCRQHDIDYAFQESKFKSDWKLFKCIKNRAGLLISLLYFSMVSTVGWIWYLKARKEYDSIGS